MIRGVVIFFDFGMLWSQWDWVAPFITSKLPLSSRTEIFSSRRLCLSRNSRSAPKLTSWENAGDGEGIDSVHAGAGHSISASTLTKWLARKQGGLVAVTTTKGEVTTLTRIDYP